MQNPFAAAICLFRVDGSDLYCRHIHVAFSKGMMGQTKNEGANWLGLARLLFYIKYMEEYIENKDGWTRSGSHNSRLRFRTFSMYIDLFIKPKSMKIPFFNPSVCFTFI